MVYLLRREGKFSYVELGQGEPFVFLHGLMGGLSNFEKVAFALAQKNKRIIIPELPLYTMPLLRSNVSSYARYIKKFIDYKGFEKVTLIGNSLGGHIALYFAKLYLDRLKYLVITGSSGLYESGMGDGYPKRGDYDFIKRKTEEVFYDPKIATKELVDEVFKTVNDRPKLIRTLSVAKSAIRHNMTKDLPNIDVPTCIIWGENDTVTPPNVAEDFKNLLPNSDLYWIPKCGHAAMMEHPEKFCEILLSWLELEK